MSTPATPTNIFSSQGNGAVYLSWDLMPGANSYVVQRSTDQITYATVASPTAPEYLDESVTLGTTYYYQVASVTSQGAYATATLTFNSNPSNLETVSIANVVFTAVNHNPTSDGEFKRGGSADITVTNLVAAITSYPGMSSLVTAEATSSLVITLTAVTVGVEGNGLDLTNGLTNVVSTPFSNAISPVQSAYSDPLSAVPAMSGEMSLGEIRFRAQQKADLVGSEFLTKSEWNWNINQSLFELYDLLVDCYEDYYLSPPYSFTTNGTSSRYPLPNGVLTFTNTDTGVTEVAPPFYKLWGVDLAANTSPDGWVTMNKFNPLDRNKYFYPNSQSTIYGVFNAQYRLLDRYIEFIPVPSGNQAIRLRYIPRLTMLLADNDLTTSGVSGWLEYVIVDAAIKALNKEESDTSSLKGDKAALKLRIESGAKNRDAGRPDTIQDTRSGGVGGWNAGGGFGGYGAGY